jgi:hypothetical protein
MQYLQYYFSPDSISIEVNIVNPDDIKAEECSYSAKAYFLLFSG